MTRPARLWIIVATTAAAVVAAFFVPRIPQNPAYHDFADQRMWLGVPRFLDVASNASFLIVGAMGLAFVLRARASAASGAFVERREAWPYATFFLGVVLSSFGSAYYHLAPDNARLVWDRLPITISFMSFLSAIIAERMSVKAGVRLLPMLIGLGIGSVVYWRFTELVGRGDLRPYALVQFCPVLVIALLVALFPPRYTRVPDLLAVAGWYGLAKACEWLDREIFSLGGVVSGHTLKHFAAAVAAYWVLRMLQKRSPRAASEAPLA